MHVVIIETPYLRFAEKWGGRPVRVKGYARKLSCAQT